VPRQGERDLQRGSDPLTTSYPARSTTRSEDCSPASRCGWKNHARPVHLQRDSPADFPFFRSTSWARSSCPSSSTSLARDVPEVDGGRALDALRTQASTVRPGPRDDRLEYVVPPPNQADDPVRLRALARRSTASSERGLFPDDERPSWSSSEIWTPRPPRFCPCMQKPSRPPTRSDDV